MLIPRHSTIIWDLDGTLLDSLQDLAEATNHALRTYHLTERSIDEVRQFVGNGVRKLMERAVYNPLERDGDGNENENENARKCGGQHTRATAQVPEATFEAIFAEFRAYYALHCNDHTRPYLGIAEVLQELRQRGVHMAIVSNKLQQAVSALHEQWFSGTIEVAIGERTGIPRKPAPDMLQIALRELPTPHGEVLYIGDSEVDLLTARAAGIPCISALWGFRSKEHLMQHGATHFATTPSDLLK